MLRGNHSSDLLTVCDACDDVIKNTDSFAIEAVDKALYQRLLDLVNTISD
jgi:hypothetical protein